MAVIDNIKASMILIEGGNFTMGDRLNIYDPFFLVDSRINTTLVKLSDFHISTHAVTTQEWNEIMGINTVGDSFPIVNISWHEVQEFISRLNGLTGWEFRLPTEAEWEFAARDGVYDQNFLFAGANIPDQVAWYKANSNNKIHEVQSKSKNLLGLYDMSGNVWEWCQDWYNSQYEQGKREYIIFGEQQPIINPQGAHTGNKKVARGGSFLDKDTSSWVFYRGRFTPDTRKKNIGFRLAY